MIHGTPAHVKCYSYHAWTTSVNYYYYYIMIMIIIIIIAIINYAEIRVTLSRTTSCQ